jgi:hypothetical protein
MLIPQDKANHIVYGTLIALAALVSTTYATLPHPVLWALGASFGVGALKEVRDRLSGKGTPDFSDFAATGLGGLLIAIAGLV